MKRLISVLFSVSLLLVPTTLFYGQTAGKAKSKTSKTSKTTSLSKKKTNLSRKTEDDFICKLPVSVIALDLDQTEIHLNCPVPNKNCSDNTIIKVRAVAIEIDQMQYIYTVSAGKILGEGANVEWDLSNVKPGSYIITAGISQPILDGTRWEIPGMTKTVVLTIKE